MLRRLLAAGFTAAMISGGLVVSAGTAHAAACPTSSPQYPADVCQLVTSSTSGEPGSDVTVSGDGFSANCQVVVKLDTATIGTAKSDGKGHFSTLVTIPSDASTGTHSLSANDACSSFVLSEVFTVTAATNGSTLPFTGMIFWPLVGGGAAALIVGIALTIGGRRRRTSTVTA